jgi:hypothetical protein
MALGILGSSSSTAQNVPRGCSPLAGKQTDRINTHNASRAGLRDLPLPSGDELRTQRRWAGRVRGSALTGRSPAARDRPHDGRIVQRRTQSKRAPTVLAR